jgi:hypothetical protein
MPTVPCRQRGAALLALASLLVLGTTWTLVAAVSSAAARSQAQVTHNARVLAEAKAALVAWVAMRALEAAEANPGRLPCPQAWGDVGSPNEGRAAAVCSAAPAMGWLPWRTLGLPALTDASGAQLWYVVSPGWHLPHGGAMLSLNSNTPGRLTLDGRRAVALLIAPGHALGSAPNAAQLAAGCVRRDQLQAIRLPRAAPNPRDFVECYSGTAFSTAERQVSNDQVLAVTAADLLPALEAAIAQRIERDIVPPLKAVYATPDWGVDAAHPVFPFAAPFTDPGASSFQGRAGTFAGLLPFAPAEDFVRFAGTPAEALEVLGYGSIASQACFWESAEARRCEGEYREAEQAWRPVRVEMSATFANVAMGLRALDSTRLQVYARDNSPSGEWLALPVTHAAALNADGSATLRFGATLPNIDAMGWGSQARFRMRIERAAIADHALLDRAAPATGWFVRNEWHRLVYYATAPEHAASGAAPRACDTCLAVANLGGAPPRALLILAGRSLADAPRPNGQLADFLEGRNATGPGFEQRAANATFNDRIVVVDGRP